MGKKQSQQGFEVPEHGFIGRPNPVLNSLPVDSRWEYTRRHPYYLLFWEQAHKHWQNPAKEGAEKLLGEVALLKLQLIGVASDPPSPGTKFEELDANPLSRAWLEGAISAMTFRGLVGAMLKELPPESRTAIGNLLTESASGEEGGIPPGYKAMSDFMALKGPSLDKTPVAPIIGINVDAPLRTILQAVELKVKEWKAQLGITEHRHRDDKLPDYLQVWDLREGWTGNGYDRRKEKTFSEIAHELGESLPTVVNRYRAAFRYITGHDYRPDLWARLFGVFKTSEIISSQAPKRALRRRWNSPKKREVPETVVAPQRPKDHRGSFLENMAVVQGMRQSAELIIDVQTLLDKGYDSQRIADELEIAEPEAIDVIEYLHRRHDEGS
jgi:hypothetical protein